ncbi:MAG: TetR/AcrR family transcriptional regulator [Bacillota bacterium]|nr:TetR/AcrR family transcriptional regulator [Bacillota bacterium]
MTQKLLGYSKQLLVDALFELMEHKKFQEITIKELAKNAEVSRLTFYRNFDSKEDILREYYEIVFSQYLEKLDNSKDSSMQIIILACYEYWKKSENHIQLILDNQLEYFLYETFENCLCTFFQKSHIDNQLKENQMKFLISGFYFSMINWISKNKNVTSEKMVKSICDMLAIQL